MIADMSLSLDPKVETTLKLLSKKEPTWASYNKAADTYDVTFKTNIIHSNLEGFAIRMWSSLNPQGPAATLVVGTNHVRPLTVEVWLDSNKAYSEPVGQEDWSEEAMVLYEGDDPEEACQIVFETFAGFYAPSPTSASQPKSGLDQLIQQALNVKKP